MTDNLRPNSDGVLNPSGVRFGSAEIYDVVEKIPGIADTLCVGQRRAHDQDEVVVLFVKMEQGHKFTNRIRSIIRDAIRIERTPRHVPKYIFEVKDIPYTMNGKKIELAVKSLISQGTVKANGAVANPEALEHYKQFYEIEKVARDQEEIHAKL